MSENKDVDTVLAAAARQLEEEELSWIRENPLAARAYFMGLRVGFMTSCTEEEWNANLANFIFFQHPTVDSDWFHNTPLGKLYSAEGEHPPETRGDAAKQDAAGCLVDHLHEMDQRWRLRMDRISRLIERCLPYKGPCGTMHQELEELDRQIEKKHGTARDAAADEAPDWEELKELFEKQTILRTRIVEFTQMHFELEELLITIARLEANQMFPRKFM
jgi:hypothetical protein